MSLAENHYLNRRKNAYKYFFEAQRKKNSVIKLLPLRPYITNARGWSFPEAFNNLMLTGAQGIRWKLSRNYMESQNTPGWKGPLEIIYYNPLLYNQAPQGLPRSSSVYLQGWRSTASLGNLFPCFTISWWFFLPIGLVRICPCCSFWFLPLILSLCTSKNSLSPSSLDLPIR